MIDEKRLKENERINTIKVIEENKNSEYWKIIEKEVKEKIEFCENFLDSFKRKGMSQKQVEQYNRIVDNMYFMKWFLKINERLVKKNMTLKDRLGVGLDYVSEKTESFLDSLKDMKFQEVKKF